MKYLIVDRVCSTVNLTKPVMCSYCIALLRKSNSLSLLRGRYTLVKNVKPKQGKKIRRVAKILCYDESNPDDSLREYEMLKGIRQQHIVRLHEAFLHNNFVYLVFDKLYGENVARSLSLKNKYNEHHVTSIIKQVSIT